MTPHLLQAFRAKSNVGSASFSARPNDWMAAGILIFLALSPIPLGSNRPFFWGINVAIIGGLGLFHVALMRRGFVLRLPRRVFVVPMFLWLLIVLAMLVQIVPLGQFGLYITNTSTDGDQIQSITISLASGATLLSSMRWVSFGLFFFLVVQVAAKRARADWMLRAMFFVIVAHAAIALLDLAQDGQLLAFLTVDAYPGAATGTFVNRNSFASYIVMGMGIGCCMALRAMHSGKDDDNPEFRVRRLFQLLYVGAGLFVMMGAIIATQSRMGAAMAVFTVFSSLLFAGLRFRGAAIIKFSVLAGMLSMILLVAVVLVGSGLLGRMDILRYDAAVRFELYKQIIEMIRSNPWTGYGAGSFEVAYPLYHREPVSPNHWWDKAHSTYLGLFSELGIIIGLAPIVTIALFFRYALQLFMTRNSAWWHSHAALVVISAVALHSLFDFSLEIDANTYQFLAIIGIGISGDSKDNSYNATGTGIR